MAFEELRLVDSARDLDVPMTALDRARVWPDDGDRAAEKDAEARRAWRADRAEQSAVADRILGGPSGEAARCRARLEPLDDEVAELTEKLAKATARRDAVRSQLAWWNDRGLLAGDLTERSAAMDPLEAASARASEAFRQLAEGRLVVERSRRSLRARLGGPSYRSVPAPDSADVRIRSGGEIVGLR